MLHSTWRLGVATVACVCLLSPAVSAGPMPEFGPSIQYSPGAPEFKIADLKGKGALVIFFQSWCPICNKWSGNMFKQVTEAYGDNRKIVLIAIKTDGGGVAGANAYLKSRGVDTSRWHVLADVNASYYKQIDSKASLYQYTLVGTEGNIVEKNKAGFYGPGMKFTLAQPYARILKKIGDAKPVLPAKKKYSSQMAPIVQAAEVCDLGTAIKYCNMAARKSALKDEALALKADLLATIKARVDGLIESLGSEDMTVKYEAYVSLKQLASKIGRSSDPAKKAWGALSEARKDKAIQTESRAHKAYLSVAAKAAGATPKQRPHAARAFASVAKRYPETVYGKLAAEKAASLK
ncbi:MAG: hypothetical protein R3236_01670 [Phycisphaeraceae bacterium]|nr:hypothetical protein [Phycisphaeraceae bacterium]